MSAHSDVIIIGAGPAGTVAAALLHNKNYRVKIIEREHFPRFSIGESLLPQCMEFLEEADLLEAVHTGAKQHHFQYKEGAAFVRREEYTDFDFREKFSPGWGTTYQVQRAPFDHLLAEAVQQQGVDIAWGYEITDTEFSDEQAVVHAKGENGETVAFSADFVLDASGFGRVLPRLLKLDRPSNFPARTSLFTHIDDQIIPAEFDRNKIRITIHPQHKDVWYWLIPFANGRSSIGVVARSDYFDDFDADPNVSLPQIVNQDPALKSLLRNANYDTPARKIGGYASNVSTLYGRRFALLGNAGEFLDPVFSSGVTIAMKSASLAVAALDRQLLGETVDWEAEFSQPLRTGIDTFRVFVEAWYDGRFQDVIFAPAEIKSVKIQRMLSSILAGYAWDMDNPYVKDGKRRLNVLSKLCRRGQSAV